MSVKVAAAKLMAGLMQSYDCSHDMFHINRVTQLAEKLADECGSKVDKLVVTLGAIFHDLIDHKYAAKAGVSIEKRLAEVEYLLKQHELLPSQIADIMQIISSVGYTKEKKLRASNLWSDWHETCVEFHCVQDADRLDAMGAIGIMRCSAYSCAVNRPLFDGISDSTTAFGHIDEKLLHLRDTLRIPLAKELGARRHQFMLDFQRQMRNEHDLLS